jgi:hypothetical protein
LEEKTAGMVVVDHCSSSMIAFVPPPEKMNPAYFVLDSARCPACGPPMAHKWAEPGQDQPRFDHPRRVRPSLGQFRAESDRIPAKEQPRFGTLAPFCCVDRRFCCLRGVRCIKGAHGLTNQGHSWAESGQDMTSALQPVGCNFSSPRSTDTSSRPSGCRPEVPQCRVRPVQSCPRQDLRLSCLKLSRILSERGEHQLIPGRSDHHG